MTPEELRAVHDDVCLTGSLWRTVAAQGLVLMYPGSGPSDRHNDVLFPPIRAALLEAGIAVCSFDKRGVGGSSGSWLDADIAAQAADLLASLAVARDLVPDVPIGLFGHSQGGWVVLDGAATARPDFLITNSGPAVTPREQETYSTAQRLRRLGWDDLAQRSGLDTFATVMDSLTQPFDRAWPQVRELPMLAELVDAGAFVPNTKELWSLSARIIDYDPRPALDALDVPLLAMLGGNDTMVPVERSAQEFRNTVRPDLLELRIIPNGDHRFQLGDEFAPGYLDTIIEFVTEQVRAVSGRHDR